MNSDAINNSALGERIRAICGESVSVTGLSHVAGGDINDAYALELSDGGRLFLKCNSSKGREFFEAERQGLEALRKTGAIGVPVVYDAGVMSGNVAYLLMEYIRSAREITGYWEDFGHCLAGMHSCDASSFVKGGRFGFTADNYIGASDQINTPHETWISFYRECRLKPQIKRAERYFDAKTKDRLNTLLERLDDLLTEPKAPALLHGDLWSGNYITGPDGRAHLIDPAVYVGHPEADIAMTQMFGGFSRIFYAAYRESGLLQDGYEDRRGLYDLYQMLNHLNLFGSGYLGSVLSLVTYYI